MSKQDKSNALINVVDLENNKSRSFTTLTGFCTEYGLTETVARRILANHLSFLNEDCTHSYVAYQGTYEPMLAYEFLVKQMNKIFGEESEWSTKDNTWEVCKVTENPYSEDDTYSSSVYTLSDRTIYLTPNYISISNNRRLSSRFPYKGLVIKKVDTFGSGEAELYYKTNLLGLYSTQRTAERRAVTDKRNPSYTPVVATPLFTDEETKTFESIHQSAQFFGVHLTTIKNKIKTGKYIDKDKVFYTLKFLGE